MNPPETDSSARHLELLGPQRHEPNLAEAIKARGIRGPIATVTAGWEEREDEDHELDAHLGGHSVNLKIWELTDRLLQDDHELLELMRERHDRLRALQRHYRRQLAHYVEAALELMREERPARAGGLLASLAGEAIATVRELDARHLGHVAEIHAEFAERIRLDARDGVQRLRHEVRQRLAPCEALCIAGGHVAILLNRLRIVDLIGISGSMPIFAWSAGAMALASRIVLFHDNPPQGYGHAEVLDQGLGVFKGLLPLPHASKRLRLGDVQRVGLFARRFAPDLCLALETHSHVRRQKDAWEGLHEARRLTTEGQLEEVAA